VGNGDGGAIFAKFKTFEQAPTGADAMGKDPRAAFDLCPPQP